MNKERLLNVAKALRESPAPEMFTMRDIAHKCGTPACALGHYAARTDLQDVFVIGEGGRFDVPGDSVEPRYQIILNHFGIDGKQEDELFGTSGCGDAKTPIEAAEYIERFVATHC